MTVILAGGGTGGHVYPALAVAEAMRRETGGTKAPPNLVYLGTPHGIERELAPRAGLEFHAVRAGALRGRNPVGLARAIVSLLIGTVEAWHQIGRQDARAVFATGGYASVPAGLAARIRRRPLVVYLPDVRPGWAVRFLAHLATRLATSSEAAVAYLPRRKTTVTGYPVRDDFWQVNKEEARRRLGLESDLPVLLISGASQGSRSLNRAVAAGLELLTEVCQVVHVSGKRDELWLLCARGNLTPQKQARYHVYSYLHNLPWAMLAADLAVMRAGASVLGELPAAGLPAILVPYPHAGAHQRFNAEYLAGKGAAVIVDDGQIDLLLATIGRLVDDRERLSAMAEATRSLARPQAAAEIARLVLEVTG